LLSVVTLLLPNRRRQLRLLAHTRHIVAVMLPLGAGIGFLVALGLLGLEAFRPWVLTVGWRTHATVLLPCLGLVLTTAWLQGTGIGEVSLFKDMDLARQDPYRVFPFWTSIGKVVACALTIGFGGSAGVEGPCKWFGAAVGLQWHRLLRASSPHAGIMRRLARPPLVMVQGGAAAALAAVFRAPLSGALMAAEHDGRLASEALIPCLVAAASGYVVFGSITGFEPLLPLPRAYPTALQPSQLFWALLLGLACGLVASLFLQVKARFTLWLAPAPLLALPAHLFWHDFPVTLGGGLEMMENILKGNPLPTMAILFLAMKLAATALTFAGGGVGGLWLPSLAMGAAVGAAFDGWLGLGQTGYLTLVGAAALAGATHQTLLVPVVFLAETTGQAALVVPALLGTIVAYLVVRERS
jgi:CIC family chloride channel protein